MRAIGFRRAEETLKARFPSAPRFRGIRPRAGAVKLRGVTGERRLVGRACSPAILFAASLAAAGCAALPGGGEPETRSADLRAAARSLVPASSGVVTQNDGDCVEFAASPSCVTVYFTSEGRSVAERVRLVERTARTSGWRAEHANEGRGGTLLDFSRGKLTANVTLWTDSRDTCGSMPLSRCFSYVDHVQVIRH